MSCGSLDEFQNILGDKFPGLKSALGAIDAAIVGILGVADDVVASISGALGSAASLVGDVISGIGTTISGLASSAMGLAAEFVGHLKSGIIGAAAGKSLGIGTGPSMQGSAQELLAKIQQGVAGVTGLVSGAISGIAGAVGDAVSFAAGLAASVTGAVAGVVSAVAGVVSSFASGVAGLIGDAFCAGMKLAVAGMKEI